MQSAARVRPHGQPSRLLTRHPGGIALLRVRRTSPFAPTRTGTAGMRARRDVRDHASAIAERPVSSVTKREDQVCASVHTSEDAWWWEGRSEQARPVDDMFGAEASRRSRRVNLTAAQPTMSKTPLHALHTAGQSIWLDYIDRSLVRGGDLSQRIARDALSGMTSNPTIFEKALTDSDAYESACRGTAAAHVVGAVEMIATDDVRDACEVFREVYERGST